MRYNRPGSHFSFLAPAFESAFPLRSPVAFYWRMISESSIWVLDFPGGSDGKESTCNQETWVNPWLVKTLWRGPWQPTLVFLPGESHGQRSLEGYNPGAHKESDMTEQLTLFTFWVLGMFMAPRVSLPPSEERFRNNLNT